VIIILGVAGSGKSTQSKLLASREGFTWVSMGEVLRGHITDDRKSDMLAGKMLDEHQVIEILTPILDAHGDTADVILDGFPRGLHQAEWLLAKKDNGDYRIDAVVHLSVHESIARARLHERGRQDDNDQAIAERFYEYEHTIKPIVALMQAKNIPIIDINTEQAPEDVFATIISSLQAAGVAV